MKNHKNLYYLKNIGFYTKKKSYYFRFRIDYARVRLATPSERTKTPPKRKVGLQLSLNVCQHVFSEGAKSYGRRFVFAFRNNGVANTQQWPNENINQFNGGCASGHRDPAALIIVIIEKRSLHSICVCWTRLVSSCKKRVDVVFAASFAMSCDVRKAMFVSFWSKIEGFFKYDKWLILLAVIIIVYVSGRFFNVYLSSYALCIYVAVHVYY